MNDLQNALQFLEQIDGLKNTYRQCLIMNGERNESTAEHSFSLAMAVMVFSQFANQPIDQMKAVKMALFHDLAEAVMGDTFHYNKPAAEDAWKLELEGLRKVLTPIASTALAGEIEAAWLEFENGETAEAFS